MNVRVLTLLACFVAESAAANYSFVILNHSIPYSLVRVSREGKYISTIAAGFAGVGMARDSEGNYLVVTGRALLRISSLGEVSTVAVAPATSRWLKVVTGPGGASVVIDNAQHALWNVSRDGRSIAKIADYPVPVFGESEDISLTTDGQGNYVVLEDNHRDVHMFKITPEGVVTQIPLSRPMQVSFGLVADGPGSYLAEEGKGAAIIRITTAGEVTQLAKFNPGRMALTGLVRDPLSGDIVATVSREHAILRVSADGRKVTRLANSSTYIRDPLAILAEIGQ